MSMDTDDRIATALERIADALEGRPARRDPNQNRRATGLGAAWDACEVADGGLGEVEES